MDNPYEGMLAVQRRRFQTGVTRSAEWRRHQLGQMRRLLTENREGLTRALYADFRKPPFEQLFEITVPLGVIDYYDTNLEALMAPEEVAVPPGLANAGNRGVLYKEPFGPTLVIGPFNAPILLLLDPAVAALAAGNPVVLKPANTTPTTASLLSDLVGQYFDPADVAVVTGGRQEIAALLDLRFDFIFFTGSSAVGKVVMRAAAEHLTPILLELGGQNPTIVDGTADLRSAANWIAWGHNAISGQWCIAPGYVCAHDDVADRFVEELRAATIRMYGEDPQQSPDLARMISEHDTERVASYILPDKVVLGGRVDVGDRYVEPTILYPSDWTDPALQQEVFGPVLPVLRYAELDGVIASIQTKERPLAAYIFTEDDRVRDEVIARLSFGGGCVNQTNIHCWVDSLPFGGVGHSGLGKYYGKRGFEALSNIKSMLVSDRAGTTDVFPPYAGKDPYQMLSPFVW
jgi:aldehyde dehydrogenase (NAD+)